MKWQWKGESEVRPQVTKQSRCRLSVSFKTWFTELKYRGKWNLLIRGQPLIHQTHAPGCGVFCGGGNCYLSVRGSYFMWTKTTLRHGVPSVCRSLWAELPCWKLQPGRSHSSISGPEVANSGFFFHSLWMTTLKANQQEWQGKREPCGHAVCQPEGGIQ